MSKYFQWLMLTMITGSPLLSLAVLVVFWWAVDRFTWRLLPDPIRPLARLMRAGKLRRELRNNPHDRRARLELGELLISRGRHREAIEALRTNIEAGDEDTATFFAMGKACLGAGHFEQAEVFLHQVEQADPDFRVGEVELVRGRALLGKGELKGAREALERFLKLRRGSVEGRVLLSRVLKGAGDDAGAALTREQAWQEYLSAPRFQRRVERGWAWRAKPSRPLSYALLVVLAGFLFARFVAPQLAQAGQPGAPDYASYEE